MLAVVLIDTNKGDFYGFTRESLSLYSIDYKTEEYIIPDGVPPSDNYWIEGILKDVNTGFVIFIIGIIYRLINNLKIGKSCVLWKKMQFDKSIQNKDREWDQVFEFIFGKKRSEMSYVELLYCMIPT